MLQIGMIVKILPDAEYSGKFTGYIGKVKNYFSQNKKVGVELFQQTNDASSKGLFWFSESKVVAAGSLPDAMMEYIKADLNATFGVANHIRRSRQTGLPQIKKVIYSGPKTIILWADNTKTIVSCGEADAYALKDHAKQVHQERVAKNPDRIAYAIQQFEAHSIEYQLKNEQTGHFHCWRKSDDKLFQFYAGTGKIQGFTQVRGIHSLIQMLEG